MKIGNKHWNYVFRNQPFVFHLQKASLWGRSWERLWPVCEEGMTLWVMKAADCIVYIALIIE